MTIIEKMYNMYVNSVCGYIEYKMTNKEIEELKTICYEIGGSMFPIDEFINDIDRNKMVNYDKNKAYKDLCLILYNLTYIIKTLYNIVKFKRDNAKNDLTRQRSDVVKGQYEAYHDVLCLLQKYKVNESGKKKKIKNLTKEEMEGICKKNLMICENCPLSRIEKYNVVCLKKEIEIEVEVE